MRDALRMHVQPTLREPALVFAFEGWNDAGEAASSAVRFLEAAVRAVPLAEIDPEDFYDFTVQRPRVALDADGARRIEWPSNEFRFGSLDAEREVVLAVGTEPHLRWRSFCDVVIELAMRIGVRRVILVGAYLADVVYSRPVGVTGFAQQGELLAKLDVEPSPYQGPTGIVGVLADRLQRAGFEVLSLWAGLPHYITLSPNPRGALALAEKLSICLDHPLDLAPLRKSAEEFEERISALVANDPELSEYVRQLKRREFAQ